MAQLNPRTPVESWRCRRFVSGAEDKTIGRARGAAEENQQRDRSLGRTQHRPIGRSGALQAGMNDIFRVMCGVGLRDQAFALTEEIRNAGGQIRE